MNIEEVRIRRGRADSAMPRTAVALGAVALAFGGVAGDVMAQRGEDAPSTVNCIALNRVDHTSVVDDDTILFYMQGDEIYRNNLPQGCPTLESEETFMYRVTIGQLCAVDVITVLSNIGSRFMPGPSCGLGKFTSISEDEAETLEANAAAHASAD